MDHLARYLPLVESLARRAIDLAIDGSPTRPAAGERVASLTVGLPVAHRLLGDDSTHHAIDAALEFLRNPTPRVLDGRGQSRPVYRCLLAAMTSRVTGDPYPVPPPDHPLLRHWWSIALAGTISQQADDDATDPAPLHTQTLDDAPEDWTYRELTALHAVTVAADKQPALRDVAHRAAAYHQQHTQPDYTTYQPWALAAFLASPDTVPFAEQQLHDVETHLAIERGPGALVPALLLADAAHSLRTQIKCD